MENIETEPTRVCPCCKKELPESAFGKDKNRKTGKKRVCKSCANAKQKYYNDKRHFTYKSNVLDDPESFPGSNCTPLAKFTDETLLRELCRRGYTGTLEQTRKLTILHKTIRVDTGGAKLNKEENDA